MLNEQVYTSGTFDPTVYHNYAIEWNSAEIIGYLDGVEWFRCSDPAALTDTPMHLRIGLDNYSGGLMQPATLDVEWARAYSVGVGNSDTGFGTGPFGEQPFGL